MTDPEAGPALDTAFAGQLPVDIFFGSDAMRAAFGQDALMQSWLDVEAALALAQAELGIIPKGAAQTIARSARMEKLDRAAIAEAMTRTAHPLVPLVRALAAAAGDKAGRHVHLGATTQDVMDTGLVLCARDGLAILEPRLTGLIKSLVRLARRYRDTPMAGRTHGQQALPTTFGLRAAGWVDELQRHQDRLAQLRPRLLTGSFGGAAGTLAGYGPKALRLRAAVMKRLKLNEPATSWHANQDRFADCVSLFGMIASTGEKIAREIYFMGRTEIGEVAEPQGTGQVGSSTMPQKRNPIRSEAVIAAAQTLRAQVPLAQSAMVAQDDRDMGAGMILWKLMPEVFILLDGILDRIGDIVARLHVNPAAMARNLASSGGLIQSEAVMLHLARALGREAAHHAVSAAVDRAARSGEAFIDCLLADTAIAGAAGRSELTELLDPRNYLGAAAAIVDSVAGKPPQKGKSKSKGTLGPKSKPKPKPKS
jgi:3-carboxy-cis,cis-muconate cycloisomerase